MTGSYTVVIGIDTLEISNIQDMDKFRVFIDKEPPRTIQEWKDAAKKANDCSSV